MAHTREVSKAMVESCQFREVPSQGIVIRGEICACMCVFVPLCVCVCVRNVFEKSLLDHF